MFFQTCSILCPKIIDLFCVKSLWQLLLLYVWFAFLGIISAQEVVADHIKTKTLEVDGLMMNKLQSMHGDIAYHHVKQDPNAVFEGGEIASLVQDEKENKKHVIAKMNAKNLQNVILAGVVTRSQYLEAHVPKDPNSMLTFLPSVEETISLIFFTILLSR